MWNAMDTSGFGQTSGGGGGFLNTSASTPTTSEKKKPERLTNVVPCTIAQIHMMSEKDENLKIGTLSAKIITFVALVQSVDVQTTKLTYAMVDYTGPGIEVQMWIGESDEMNRKVNIITESTFARVTGAIRSIKGKRHVIAFNIQSIQDVNEITMHMAEVIHTSMAAAVMDKQSGTMEFKSNNTYESGMDTSSMDTYGSSNSRKLSKPQQLVKQAVLNCKDEQGLNVNEIYNGLKSLTRQSIQEALDFLSNEGHIYSTIDEDHYKCTDCI